MGAPVAIPTEPIGSIPRSAELMAGFADFGSGRLSKSELETLGEAAVADTVRRFEATGSPVVTDGEQLKPSFVTYPLHGLENLAPDGVRIDFTDGHHRQLPRLKAGPFRYGSYCGGYVALARRFTRLPVKQAVIAPSALSLLYPADGIPGYPRETFIEDLIVQAERDIRSCFEAGAASVQLDFTEGRLCVKLDPSRGLLRAFVDLNNRVLARFSEAERRRIGVHTCPGGDHDATHSADVDYAELLPDLFRIDAGAFFLELAAEKDPVQVLDLVKRTSRPNQRIFVGVTDSISAHIETAEVVRDRVLLAAEYLPLDRLGTTDDCGFSPFGDDVSTARDTAFAKITARVSGTAMAASKLGAAS